MSLDVYLTIPDATEPTQRDAIFIRRDGSNVEVSRGEWDDMHPGREPVTATITVNPGEPEEVFSRNITHNLGKMADAAGIYRHLWRPDEIDITRAWQLTQPLTEGLARLKADPATARLHNPANGWGDYEGLVAFVEAYLAACRQWPDAHVNVSR
jgi:hypothetical protein